jgi:single-strand DNA-binding protein
MASFNRVILLGNLTRDPQLRYLPSNMAVCEFGLATSRRWRDRDGNQKEEVCFIDVEAFGRQAETINQYLTKGRSVLIEGHLRLDTWTGQDGQKRSKHRVVVESFQFVGGRGEATGSGPPAERGAAAAPPGRPASEPPAAPYEVDETPPTGDEIPF